MKAYSCFNLMEEELYVPEHPFWGFFTRKDDRKLQLGLSLPAHSYLRAKIFLDDLYELYEVRLTHKDLVSILYADFLSFVRKTQDFTKIYSALLMKVQDITIMDQTSHHETNTTEIRLEEDHLHKMIYITLKRKEILRGEVILSDLSQFYPDHPFTLEKVLEIMYCGFLEEHRKGNTRNVMEKIIEHCSDK